LPLLDRRGGCGNKKKVRSIREAADGVVVQEIFVELGPPLLMLRLSGSRFAPASHSLWWLRVIFYVCSAPLLSSRGKSLARFANPFRLHTFYAKPSVRVGDNKQLTCL
jgi:hypothetical protein